MFTEFELHAFIDGEMTGDERATIVEASAKSPRLRAQLAQLLRLKDLVRASYHEVEQQDRVMLDMIS